MTCGMPAMFYFYSHRGPQWSRMWKAGHGLLCGHRGLKPLWNEGHGLLCGHRGLKMEQDLKYWPRFTLWASRFQDGTRREMPAMDYFVGIEVSIWNGTWNAGHVSLLWTLRSQDGTGREMPVIPSPLWPSRASLQKRRSRRSERRRALGFAQSVAYIRRILTAWRCRLRIGLLFAFC